MNRRGTPALGAGICSVLLLVVLFTAGAVAAQPPVDVRSGNHSGYGRLVFDFPAIVPYSVSRQGTLVEMSFATQQPIDAPAELPRNVAGFLATPGEARITIVPGAAIRDFRVDKRIVLDVLNVTRADPQAADADSAAAMLVADRKPAVALPMPPPAIPLPLPPLPQSVTHPPAIHPSAPEPTAQSAAKKPAIAKPPQASPPLAPPEPATPTAIAAAGEAAQPVPPPPSSTATVAHPSPPPKASNPAIPAIELGPLAIAAQRVAAPPGAEAALLVPFGPRSGAAAFRRGNDGVVVFDQARPIDMSGLAGDPAFGAATVSLLPAATVLRLPLPPTLRLRLWHRDEGWVVGVTAAPRTARAIVSKAARGHLSLKRPTAAEVVLVPDPASGTNLLVGTARVPGDAVAVTRRLPSFVLLRTWLGVAVEPLTDRLALRANLDGFTLGVNGRGGLPLSTEAPNLAALENGATLTRRFDFPARPLAVMARRLHQELDAAVAAPPLDRFAPRLAEAETLVALGMGPEAATLIKLARIDDPRRANDPDAKGLGAIAALLSGRPGQSSGLDDPRLSGSDEIDLWRAARAALLHQDPVGTAPVFTATAGLILAYPEPLRNFLAPIAAEAMIEGGARAAAGLFLKHLPATPALDFDRALLFATHGKTPDVLAAWERLAHSLDRRVAARAASRVVLLRLATGAIGPKTAADALSRQFYDWRGGRHELKLRLKVAALRAKAGEWRKALALLSRTEELFPAEAAAVRSAREATFRSLFAGQAAKRVPPLDLVSLIEDNADLIPPGRAGEKLAEMLADRLLALDLPDRAQPVLEKLMAAAPAGAPEAGIGARLATVRLARDDPAGALKALAASRAANLPRPLAVQRTMIYARAKAALGHTQQAVSALAALNAPSATALAADLLQKAGDWAGVEAALAGLVATTVAPGGTLTEADRTMLVRLASAAAQAGDAAELALLRTDYDARMGGNSLGNMFHLLTDPPANGLADLPEVGRETKIAGQLPSELKAIGATVEVVP
ncbi:MAG: hypothetical protein ACREFP_20995 [Acetobacteraceae bacterium]